MVNISVLGVGKVGKTCITYRYVFKSFMKNYINTFEDQYSTKYRDKENGDEYTIFILDTAGAEDFFELREAWMQDKDGFVFAYAIDEWESLVQLRKYY